MSHLIGGALITGYGPNCFFAVTVSVADAFVCDPHGAEPTVDRPTLIPCSVHRCFRRRTCVCCGLLASHSLIIATTPLLSFVDRPLVSRSTRWLKGVFFHLVIVRHETPTFSAVWTMVCNGRSLAVIFRISRDLVMAESKGLVWCTGDNPLRIVCMLGSMWFMGHLLRDVL